MERRAALRQFPCRPLTTLGTSHRLFTGLIPLKLFPLAAASRLQAHTWRRHQTFSLTAGTENIPFSREEVRENREMASGW